MAPARAARVDPATGQRRGLASYFTGDYEGARAALLSAKAGNPEAQHAYRFLIATYGQMGDPDEAQWIAMEYETTGGSAIISDMLENAALKDEDYLRVLAEGLSLAGLPES